MSRYLKEFSNNDITDPILTLATGGLNIVAKLAVDAILPGKIPLKWYCKITDTKSGAYATGEGYSRGEASADAWFRLTGEKDDTYKQNDEERRRKKAEWEHRQKEREQKQKEWELKKKEQEQKKIEWEQRQREREKKQKEWELRKQEQERKKAEWEKSQRERERKKAEWEQRQREREQKQREYEQRQREREIKKAEWEARKAESERRRQDYQDRQRNRSNRGGGRGSSGGCYITTATCKSLSKGDDCIELNTIRNFRDNWLSNQKNGIAIILDYYEYAPLIVEKIDNEITKDEIYYAIWTTYLDTFFQLIQLNKFKEAMKTYLLMVDNLKEKYISEKKLPPT